MVSGRISCVRPLVFVGVAALLAGASMTADSTPHRPLTGRSQVATRLGIVAASQVLAARAGVQVLERGGNAVDAAIATNAVMGLMEPTSNGIGGDLFALVYEAKTGTLHGLNASGWAPRALTPEYLNAAGVTELPSRGPYTVTVPGVVAGWHSMREKFGRLPMADLLAPAIHYAKEGFPVAEVTAGLWARSLALLEAEPNAARTFLVDGRVPAAGAIFRNPDLARSLARIAERGRDGYYKGPTAEAIVAMLKPRGSPMDAQDLAEFDVEWVQPISTTYRGWKVSEIPPNGQGIAALIMLNLMEPFPMGDFGFHSPRALHTMIEAKKLAYADLIRYVGDQRFGEVPVGAMLDKGRAQTRAGRIDPARAQCRVEPSQLDRVTDMQGHDTIYLSVVDRDGNMVSLIQSNYLGLRVRAGSRRRRLHAPQSRRAVHAGAESAQHACRPQAPAAHDHPRLHGEGRHADLVWHHGRLEPGAGPRAVCRRHRRLRLHAAGSARSRTVHEGHLRRL